jgi:hypothetical protein
MGIPACAAGGYPIRRFTRHEQEQRNKILAGRTDSKSVFLQELTNMVAKINLELNAFHFLKLFIAPL